jgi:hypothetical protein
MFVDAYDPTTTSLSRSHQNLAFSCKAKYKDFLKPQNLELQVLAIKQLLQIGT